MTPVRLFCAPRFKPEKEDVRIIRSYGSREGRSEPFLKALPADWSLHSFVFTNAVTDADFVLIPQAVKRITPAWQSYFNAVVADAETHGKRVILFIGSDLGHRLHVEHPSVVVFKGTEYALNRRTNEIITPGYAEDLGSVYGIKVRNRHAKPTVSFCGYAGFPTYATYAKYLVTNLMLDIVAFATGNMSYRAHKRGIYFRRAAMHNLKSCNQVETSFVLRDQFTGKNTADPARLRAEYIDNMIESDFVLCPKGDGNYSVRFYEALSLGRIPILIDTDMVLPLEKSLVYSRFILRIPHTELSRISDIVADFYTSLSQSDFVAMQQNARKAFTSHLRYDSFFNTVLPLLKDGDISMVR